MTKRFLCFFVLLCSLPCFAGAKGYTAVMFDIGDQSFFESKGYIFMLNEDYEITPQGSNCWSHRATGEMRLRKVIRKKVPVGMTKDLATAIWNGDKSAVKRARKIMAEYKGPSAEGQEIDGMYILKPENGTLSLMALGTRGPIDEKNPSKKLSISWNNDDPRSAAAELDLALCKVSKPLDFGFDP